MAAVYDMKAIKIVSNPGGAYGQKAELQDVPLPKLRDGYVLCKVLCVGLNPTDWSVIVNTSKHGGGIVDKESGSTLTAMEVSQDVRSGVICVWLRLN